MKQVSEPKGPFLENIHTFDPGYSDQIRGSSS